MRYVKAVFVLLALSVFLGSPAYSSSTDDSKSGKSCDKKHGKRGDEGQRGHKAMMDELLASLELSDAQRTDIEKFRLEYRKKTVVMQADIEVAAIELKELLTTVDVVDLDAVREKIDDIAALKADLKFYRIKMLEELKRDKLNKEQRKKLREFMNDRVHGASGGGRH